MNKNIYCPGGNKSQSGAAVKERYPHSSIHECKDLGAIKIEIEENSMNTFVIPVWNSHEGEVRAAEYIWDFIEQSKIQIYDIWAKTIEFWHVRRTGDITEHGKIGSVRVAKTQCSKYLAERKSTLTEYGLTNIAFDKYREGDEVDGVLVAPGQGENEEGFEILSKETANPNNFTSFVNTRIFNETPADGLACYLTGVAIKPLDDVLGSAEEEFFSKLFDDAGHVDDIPRLIFVIKRIAKVGLILESKYKLHSTDFMDAEQLDNYEMSIYDEVGSMDGFYSEELNNLFTEKYTDLISADFILHQGENTCLFVCPPLGLFTHGFEAAVVEPVIKFYISKFFESVFEGNTKCSPPQMEFFERHKDAWLERRSAFVNFKVIS